jgi:hypothetical protein
MTIYQFNNLKIRTDYHWDKPDSIRGFVWTAVDDDSYDVADDSSNNKIGYGATEAEAVLDLIDAHFTFSSEKE